MPYQAGTVFLQVVPSFDGVQRAIRREARKAGRAFSDDFDDEMSRAGTRSGEHLGTELDRGVKRKTKRTGEEVGEQLGEGLGKGVDRSSGQFATTVRRRLEAALARLPDVEVDADTSDAMREIAKVRAELQALRGSTKNTISVNSRDALAKVAELERRLNRLGRDSEDIDVRVDASGAMREMAEVGAMAAALGARDVNIDVDVNSRGAMNGLRRIARQSSRTGASGSAVANSFRAFNGVLLGVAALGPAVIPVLAGVAGGVAAVGASAAVAAPGIGALILGFSGLTDAAQALVDVQVSKRAGFKPTDAQLKKIKETMTALSPAGRRFARYLAGLYDGFRKLRGIAQRGILPGVKDMMQSLGDTYARRGTRLLGNLARVLGEVFRMAGRVFTSPVWQRFFKVFEQYSATFIRQWSAIGLNVISAFAAIITAFAPFAEKMNRGLLKLTNQFLKWAASLAKSKEFQDFLNWLQRVGPEIWDFLVALVGAIINMGKALAPFGELILKALTGILKFIAGMDPDLLGIIVMSILALVVAMQAMFAITSAVTAVGSILAAVILGLISPIGLVVAGVILLAGVFVILWVKSKTFRKIVTAVWDAVKRAVMAAVNWIVDKAVPWLVGAWNWIVDAAQWLWRWVKKVWNWIGDIINWVWRTIIHPVINFIVAAFRAMGRFFRAVYNGFIFPIIDLIGHIFLALWRGVIHPVINQIISMFRAMGRFFRWVWNRFLHPVFNQIGAIFRWLWRTIVRPTLHLIQRAWNAFAHEWGKIYRKRFKPIIDFFADAIKNDLPKAVRKGVDWIKAIWNHLKGFLSAPIRFVIKWVLNKGLIAGFNKLAHFFGSKPMATIPIPKQIAGHRRGGVEGVRPGYTPGRDTHLIGVGGGEAIMRPEWTRAVGSATVHAWNRIARTKGIAGVRRFMERGYSGGGVVWPVRGARPGTRFGVAGSMWSSGYHTGQDFPAPVGANIRAALAGKVKTAYYGGPYGRHAIIKDTAHLSTLYAHMSRMLVHVGQLVNAGQHIGDVGATGNVTGPHLHFELRKDGRPVDPMPLLTGDKGWLAQAKSGLGNIAQWVLDAISAPAKWIKSKFTGALGKLTDKFGNSGLVDMLKAVPHKLVSSIASWISEHFDPATLASGGNSELQQMVKQMALTRHGWGGSQFAFLRRLIDHESSWNPTAQNPTSTAYGLFQFLNSTWGSVGGHKTSNPRLQAIYGLRYIAQRYGDPRHAWNFWNSQSPHWYAPGGVAGENDDDSDGQASIYDTGGKLPPGLTKVLNATGRNEWVLRPDQLDTLAGQRGVGRPALVGTVNQYMSEGTRPSDAMAELDFKLRHIAKGGVYANS